MLEGDWGSKDFIPAKLHIGNSIAEANCGGLLSYQGAHAYELAPGTVAEIKSQGLRFFDDIGRAGNQARISYYNYPWRSTPIVSRPGESWDYQLSCAMEHHRNWPASMVDDLHKKGGFYTTDNIGRALIVVPHKRYLIAVMSDR